MPYAGVDDPEVFVDDADVHVDGFYLDTEPPPVVGFDTDYPVREPTVRWEVLDREHVKLGEIHPRSDQAADFSWSISGEAGRVLRDLNLLPDEAADLDPAQHRIRPIVPFDGEEWPFGVYRISDADVVRWSGGDLTNLSLPDEQITLSVKTNRALSWPRGRSIDLIAAELASYFRAIPFVEVDASTAELGEPLAFPFGSVTWQEVANEVAKAGGFLPPHFSNAGVWRWRTPPSFDVGLAEFVYRPDDGDVVFRSLSEGVAFLDSPNVWYVVTAGAADPVIARYALPARAPNSIENLGFEIPEIIEQSAIADGDTASGAARAAAAGSLDDVGKASLSAPLDPRHELFAHVQVGSYHYREVGFSGTVSAASVASHDLRRVYRNVDADGDLLGGAL